MLRILDYCCYTTWWLWNYGSLVHISRVHRSIRHILYPIWKVASSPPRVRGKMFSDDMHIHGPVRGEKWCSSDPGVPCNEDGRITQLGEYVKEYLNYFIIFDNIRHGHDAEIMNIRDFRGNVRVELCFSKYRHLSGISLEQGDEVSFSSHFGNWI